MAEVLPARSIPLVLGSAPIVDFDGTVAVLPVDWHGLRAQLGVARLDDLWAAGSLSEGRWAEVAAAETAAAEEAAPVELTVAALRLTTAFAVLTNNSADAVHRFCDRHPDLRQRLALVVGRERLGGPKTDFARFRAGFAACSAAIAPHLGIEPVVYAGDQDYELAFARHLGARTIDVTAPRRPAWLS